MRILLLEDDASLREGIAFKLGREGHEVLAAATLAEARGLLSEALDFAILDIGLPDGSGLEICRALRRKSPDIFLLMLTAQDTEVDEILGYESGCDDYLTKPFSLSVLMAKIAAAARRSEKNPANGLRLDAARQTATLNGARVELSRNEMRLLDIFLRHSGQILTKEQLLSALWDAHGEFVNENTLAVNIRRLREKIEKNPSAPEIIVNVRGVGYKLCEKR